MPGDFMPDLVVVVRLPLMREANQNTSGPHSEAELPAQNIHDGMFKALSEISMACGACCSTFEWKLDVSKQNVLL